MKKKISLILLNKQMLKIDHVQILGLDLAVGQGPERKAGQGQDPIHQDQNRDPGAEVGPAHCQGLGLRVEPLKGPEDRNLDLDQYRQYDKQKLRFRKNYQKIQNWVGKKVCCRAM